MIKVKYERYWNDFIRKNEEKTFTNLDALAEWIFGQMQQDYTKDSFVMSFPTPKKAERIGDTGPWRIEFKPQRGGESIWIYLIESLDGIIFSDGRFTSGQKHWSSEVKEWLTTCDKRQHEPKFNFADEHSSEPEWFAITRWAPEDVVGAAEEQGVTLSVEQATAWWKRNERRFQNLLVERGNEILAEMDFEEVDSDGKG